MDSNRCIFPVCFHFNQNVELFIEIFYLYFSLIGVTIVEDTDSAWFPESELREIHGIVPYEPTELEAMLFCIKPDGTEGMCCPTYGLREQVLQEDE